MAKVIRIFRILLFVCLLTSAFFSRQILFELAERSSVAARVLSSSPCQADLAQESRTLSCAAQQILAYFSGPLAAILVLLGLLVLLGPWFLCRVLRSRILSPPDSTSDKVFLTAVFLACLALGLGLNAIVFHNFRITPDENNYLDQARVFAGGRLFAEAPPLPEFFEEPFLVHKGGRLFVVFQPGWSLLLAPAVWLGVERAMPALIGACALLAVFFLARRLAGRAVARGSVLIMLLSPYFIFYTATYFSHIAGLLWICLFVLLFFLARDEQKNRFYLLAGGCLGAAMATRYFDLLFGFPFGLLLLWEALRRRPGALKNLFLFCIPLLLAGVLCLLYQSLSTGDLWMTPYKVYYSQARNAFLQSRDPAYLFGFSSEHTPMMALKMSFRRILDLNLWIFPFALVFLPPALVRPGRRMRLILAGLFCLLFLYSLYVPRGGWEYGPRYYLPMYGCLAILLAMGISRTLSCIRAKWGEGRIFRGLAYGLLLCLVMNICLTVYGCAYISRWIYALTDHQRLLREQNIEQGVVFVTMKPDFFLPEIGKSKEEVSRDLVTFLIIRNGMDFRRPILFAHSLGEAEDRRLISSFPDRTFYQVQVDPFAVFFGVGRGTLDRLDGGGLDRTATAGPGKREIP